MFLRAREAVITGILPDDGAVLLLDETVIVFFMVAASCKGDGVRRVVTPIFHCVINEFGAVITVKLLEREWNDLNDILEGAEKSMRKPYLAKNTGKSGLNRRRRR